MKPRVSALWPAAVDEWFRALLRQQPIPSPVLTMDDWESWLTAVHHHRLPALLYHWFKSAPLVCHPPPAIMGKLQTNYLMQKAHTVYRWAETQHILKLFQQTGIQAVVLKGTALAESHYGQPELRPSIDIDLLIPLEQYPSARQTLLAASYKPQIEVSTSERKWRCEEAFLPGIGGAHSFLIELHWSLSPYIALIQDPPLPALFQRATTISANQLLMPIPDPIDATVHAALHLCYGHPEDVRLIWLYDLHLLTQNLSADSWAAILATSKAWQARLALADALQLTHEWFGTVFPATVADLTNTPPTTQEFRIQELASYRLLHGPRFALMQRNFYQWEELNFRERLQFMFYRAFPGREAIDMGYPQWRKWPLPLAYLARLMLFSQRYLQLSKK